MSTWLPASETTSKSALPHLMQCGFSALKNLRRMLYFLALLVFILFVLSTWPLHPLLDCRSLGLAHGFPVAACAWFLRDNYGLAELLVSLRNGAAVGVVSVHCQ